MKKFWTQLCLLVLMLASFQNTYANQQRIVTIDGSLTEIVYALGLGDRVVGRDVTSTYPVEATKLPSVGYMRALSSEGILSLNPSVIFATTDAKPRKVLDQLKEAGVEVVLIKNTFSLKGVENKVMQVAKYLKVEAKGKQLVKKIQQSVADAQAFAKQQTLKNKAKGIFVLSMRGGNIMAAGENTRADVLMKLASVDNPAASAISGYKPLTAEAAIEYNPQIVLTMQHGVKSAGGKNAILNTPAIRMTEAGMKKRLIVLDNGALTFGPRLGEAITDLVKAVNAQ